MLFSKDNPNTMYFKYSHHQEDPFMEVNFQRGRSVHGKRSADSGQIMCIPLYNEPKKIMAAKMQDLVSLLKFVPPVYHGFYNALNGSGKETEEFLPDEVPPEEESNEI